MIVKTLKGPINCPEPTQIGPRVKWWAEALHDVVRIEEIYGVLAAGLLEAYQQGRLDMLQRRVHPIVDVPFEVLDEKREDVERDSKELDQQIQLAEAEGMGQSAGEVPENREALPQGDGDPGRTS
jgi:hypothetical protein